MAERARKWNDAPKQRTNGHADDGGPRGPWNEVAEYNYTDQAGAILFQVARKERVSAAGEKDKDFRQRRPDGKGGWEWKQGERRVLYRWPDLCAHPDATVFVCEGEKDADRLASLDHCATTAANGNWKDVDVACVAGRDVIVLQDNDEAGRKKAAAAALALHGLAKSVRIVALPDLPEKGDVSDWLDADPANAKRLAEVCFDAPLWAPRAEDRLIKSSAEFIAGFVPPDYTVVGLLIRRFLYSLTGQTGSGKTAITLRLAASVALGMPFAGRETKRCRVLYAAAENPDDVRMRWIALAQHMAFDPNTIEVYFTEGAFSISELAPKLRAEAEKIGGEFGLVIVHVARVLRGRRGEQPHPNGRPRADPPARSHQDRSLGGPTVVANCHPRKDADADNLLPAGGGSFVNEVDGEFDLRQGTTQ